MVDIKQACSQLRKPGLNPDDVSIGSKLVGLEKISFQSVIIWYNIWSMFTVDPQGSFPS